MTWQKFLTDLAKIPLNISTPQPLHISYKAYHRISPFQTVKVCQWDGTSWDREGSQVSLTVFVKAKLIAQPDLSW